MITYQQTHERFTTTKKPPRSKKYADNQRPLRRVPESHLMLQRDNHSYVYIINGAEVARYFDPDEHGNYEVAVRGLYATYDINLMWKFTGLYSCRSFETSTGDTVRVPFNPYYRDQDKDYSALLHFNSSDQLVVEKSWHADVYRLASTDEDKQKRKDLKAELDAYVTLQLFKLPTLRANAKPSAEMGAPFGETDLSYSLQSSMRDALSHSPLPLDSQSFLETFDEVAQDCYNMLLSKKAYVVDGGRTLYRGFGWAYHRNPADGDDARETINTISQSITPEEFKKSLVARLMSFAGLSKGSQSVPLPQFANTLPRTYYTRANK